MEPLLGAHVSTAGGLATAFGRAERLGSSALQIFTKNRGAWGARDLRDDEIRAFHAAARDSSVRAVVAHAAYLLNIASPDRAVRERSIEALRVELERCEALGIPGLVLHPGSHIGCGEEAGLRRAARAIDLVHRATRGFEARILLENSAGQGSSICSRISSLGAILSEVLDPERLGVCIDTCHLFAAGYDLRSAEGYERAVEELDREVGLGAVRCIHTNDSKRELGSRVDRHERPGKGKIGAATFRRIVRGVRFRGVPMILELPPVEARLRRDIGLLGRWASRRSRARLTTPREDDRPAAAGGRFLVDGRRRDL